MKKQIISVLASFVLIFSVSNLMAQAESTLPEGPVIEFLPAKNSTELPKVIVDKLASSIQNHIQSWNRVAVAGSSALNDKGTSGSPIDSKPAPTKTGSSNTTEKSDVKAYLQINSFKSGLSAQGMNGARVAPSQAAEIHATMYFLNKGEKVASTKVNFSGTYSEAATKAQKGTKATVFAEAGSKGKKSTSKKSGFDQKKSVVKKATKNALADFKNKARHIFTHDFELVKVLEGKSDGALTTEMNAGNMMDVKVGYEYHLYTVVKSGPKQTEEKMVGNMKILGTKGVKSIGKIINGGDMVHSYLHGENKRTVMARLAKVETSTDLSTSTTPGTMPKKDPNRKSNNDINH